MQNGKDLAILAGSCGLVANTDDGRQAFCAWWANDPKAARAALFTRVAARRVAAKAESNVEYKRAYARTRAWLARRAAEAA